MPAIDVLFFKPDFSSLGFEQEEGDVRAFVVMRVLDTLLGHWPSTLDYPCLCSVREVAIAVLQMAFVSGRRL